uniref:Uncharacterized protein n=1 Tax=Anguilla anguilla TaxID=7936 RepID=A0A0E9P7M1_ANGAN
MSFTSTENAVRADRGQKLRHFIIIITSDAIKYFSVTFVRYNLQPDRPGDYTSLLNTQST